jgi:uncharacterized Tic20 family protein
MFFGEAVIFLSFLLFGGNLFNSDLNIRNISWLNFAVTSVIFFLWFGQTFMPWLSLRDKSGKEATSLGFMWTGIFIYSVLAILTMLGCNKEGEDITFGIQLAVHLLLFFLLLFALFLGIGAKRKAAKAYEEEQKLAENKEISETTANSE